jgi:glycine/D-amino acid oxidase-like deaminating enzyme
MKTAPQWHTPQFSFWQRQAPLNLASDPLPPTAEVVVIGGGLLGCSTAYWLARNGVRVIVLEQTAPAFGATGRNGGFHVIGTSEAYHTMITHFGHADAKAIYQITLDSRGLLRQVLAEEQLECEYREPGRLNLELNEAERTAHAAAITALRADGFEAEQLDRAQVQDLIHTPLGPEIVGGIFAREDGLLQPARFVHGMLAAARRHGAQICCAQATSITSEGSGVRIETNAGPISAGAVIVAINAWSDQLIPAIKGIITPVRGQILAYAPIPLVFPTGIGASVTATGEYWHQTPDGSIVLGGCRAIAADGEVGLLAEGTTPAVQAAIEGVFPRLFPQLHGLQVAQRWSGPMAFTRDHTPIADCIPGIPHAWFVGGFSGHGMPFGMRVGQLLAEAATNGNTPAELHALRLDRPTL